jgi:hypothetical protein
MAFIPNHTLDHYTLWSSSILATLVSGWSESEEALAECFARLLDIAQSAASLAPCDALFAAKNWR